MTKKVLIVSYLFPPIGGGGVQRALKMAKYLGQYGWEPHILTVDEDVYFASKDASLLEQLPPGVHIHRAKQLDIIGKVTGQAATNKGTKKDNRINQQPNNSSSSNMNSIKGSLRKLLSLVKPLLKAIKNRIFIPDEQILWKNQAVKLGLEVIKKHNIQAIFSTSGPNTNHLVALELKKQTGLAWIADFRDPWTDNMHRSGIWWREKLEASMEAKVIKTADEVMTVTDSFLQGFYDKYGSGVKRGAVVHNGYDTSDYKELLEDSVDGAHTNDKFKLAYTGIFYDMRNPRLLLQAIHELIQEGKVDQHKVELHFAGIFDYPGQNANWQAVVDTSLEQQVILHGQLPHQKALRLLAGSDVQLLIADTHETAGAYIPGKLFEYIAIGKPILALSHRGESTDIIESIGAGVVANPTSLSELKASVTVLYSKWLETGMALTMPADIREKTKKYQRHEQARMLAEELDRISR